MASFAISLGKTVAQISVSFSPIPGLCPAADLLCGIIQLCENVTINRHAARQLRDRCHSLLLALRDYLGNEPSNSMTDALTAVNECLLHISTKMNGWAHTSTMKSFTRQNEIQQDIGHCHQAISDCLTKFTLASQMSIDDWQNEFAINAHHDHAEVVEYLSSIQNSQSITNDTLSEQHGMIHDMMGMMQTLLGENKQIAHRTHNGLSNNLYQLQRESGQLLPNLQLESGEVIRVGQHPVSGTAAMDIYEGLYLHREKVAIKVVRAVNSNEHSLRRFMREVKIWTEIWNIDHGKHILPFYGFCQSDGPFPYMVSPWQQNGSALTYVKNNDKVVNYKQLIKNIALGIQVLHTMTPPVVHGDIKASNIVINSRGEPLIADFGLSQIVEDITGIPFTQSRGVSDSYRWFAPEVCVGQGVLSISSDVYAYAMTVLELITHQQPYRNIKHTTEVVIRSSRGEHPPRPIDPSIIARGLDTPLWSLLNLCWATESLKRPSIQQVLTNLS